MQNLKLFIKALRYKISDLRNSRAPKSNWHKSLLLYPFRLFAHPIETFNDLKYENKASLWIANAMAVLFCLVRMLEHSSTAYLFKGANADETSTVTIFLISAITIIAWTICNWATCTLFDGEGSMKDIWVATTYSLLPYIIFSLITTALSHVFTTSETAFYTFFGFLGTAWTLLLIFLGLLVVHQYTVMKNIASVLGTVLIIACLVFLALLFISIFQQMYSFILNIINELVVRNL